MTATAEMEPAPRQVADPRPSSEKMNKWPLFVLGGIMIGGLGAFTVVPMLFQGPPPKPRDERPDTVRQPSLPPGLAANYGDIPAEPKQEPEEKPQQETSAVVADQTPQQQPVQNYGGGGNQGPSRKEILRDARMSELKPFSFAAYEQERGGSEASEARSGKLYSKAKLEAPFPCQVDASTNIPALLEQRLKSETPGIVSAVTVKDIWSSDKSCLAIPRNTRFVGTYGTKVEEGQARLGIIWTALTRPPPRKDTIDLDGTVAGEPDGTAGVEGDVNTHFWRKFVGVAASTLVDLGKTTVTAGGEGGLGAAVAGIFAGRASSPLDEWANRQINIPNTIEVGPKSQGRAREISIVLAQHLPMSEFRKRR